MLDLFPTLNAVLAFPGGTGTNDMKKQAAAKGILVISPEDLLQV